MISLLNIKVFPLIFSSHLCAIAFCILIFNLSMLNAEPLCLAASILQRSSFIFPLLSCLTSDSMTASIPFAWLLHYWLATFSLLDLNSLELDLPYVLTTGPSTLLYRCLMLTLQISSRSTLNEQCRMCSGSG